jgi:hypothetical protein
MRNAARVIQIIRIAISFPASHIQERPIPMAGKTPIIFSKRGWLVVTWPDRMIAIGILAAIPRPL